MARMLFVLGYTRHIIRHRTHEPLLHWRQRITVLCHQLGISKPVRLLESKIVKLPVVFGQLKPVILVPLGLLAQLAPEQVEAILLHELAHIRRCDYLVNLLQNIIETLFFFNPALLWLSSLIRDERENCCDDVAIDQLKSRKQYIESLISFKERAMYISPLSAVGFAGRKNSFINRVRRIVENKNYTLSRFEKGSLACSSVVAASLALAVVVPGGTGFIQPASPSAQIKAMSARPMVVLGRYTDTLTSAERLTSTVRWKARAEAGHRIIKMHKVIAYRVREKVPGHGYFLQERPSLPPPHPKAPWPFHGNETMESILAEVAGDLVAEGIVKDKSDPIAFLLTNRKLIVNGQLQPESIHERLKEKYISANRYTLAPGMAEDPDFGLHYNSKNGSMGLGIHHWADNQMP
jgi:hypothetical protein